MANTINKIIDIYAENAKTTSPKRALLMLNMSWISEIILIIGLMAIMLVAMLHFIEPIYGYFWQHQFKALFPLYIPFVDEKTEVGFVILISIQSIEIFAAAVAGASVDLPFMISVINVWIFYTIFEDNTNEWNAILRE